MGNSRIILGDCFPFTAGTWALVKQFAFGDGERYFKVRREYFSVEGYWNYAEVERLFITVVWESPQFAVDLCSTVEIPIDNYCHEGFIYAERNIFIHCENRALGLTETEKIRG